MASSDSVSLAEPLQNINSLGGQLIQASLHWKEIGGSAIDGLDETSINEPLTNGSCHLLRHRKGSGGCSGDNAGWVLGIGHTIGLGEFQRSQIVNSLIGREGMLVSGEAHTMSIQFQADHQCSK